MKLKFPTAQKSRPGPLPLFEALPEHNDTHMSALRGDSKARMLLVTPCPDQNEYDVQVPFSNEAAKKFHLLLLDDDLDTQKDFLVVSSCRYGLKPKKDATDIIQRYVETCARRDYFDLIVSIGSDTFKFLFGNGKKPSSNTIYGKPLYLEALNHKPLFAYPDITVFAEEPDGYRSQQFQNTFTAQIRKYNHQLKVLVDSLK